ncbi:MAG: signal peptidase II [Planctomycetes bacterium]|nr:signal peptidase II [Planctomycetota bacterium]
MTKAWAQGAFDPESPTRWSAERVLEFQRNFLCLEFVWQWNPGAVFGVAQGKTVALVVFNLLALTLLVWLFADSRKRQGLLHLCLGMIVAGALGNLYDRLVYQHVRDFLRFSFRADWVPWDNGSGYLWPYVINVADVYITVGVAGLFLIWLVAMIRHRREPPPDAPQKKRS